MIPTIVISILTAVLVIVSILFFPTIKIGKVHLDTYWIFSLLGAAAILAFGFAPIDEVWGQLTSNAAINPLKILVLFFSMTILSIFLDEFGLFRYLANAATKRAKGNQYALFFAFYGLTSLLTIFTSNDVVILTLTPFICFFCKNAKITPIPYLVAEFAGANTWSLMFVIGNPTNIYLATSAGIDFMEYLRIMWLPTFLAGITELAIIFLLFHNKLKDPLTTEEESFQVPSKLDLIVGVAHLGVCLVFLVISSYINVEMWVVSLACASSLFLFVLVTRIITKSNWQFVTNPVKRLPYPLIPFFLSMFVIVVALNYQGVSARIAELLGSNNVIWVYGMSSFLASDVINNIPMSILFSNLDASLTGGSYIAATYASIIGSNIGAFLTPIGALAGIMFSHLVKERGIKYSFADFSKYGAIIALPTIAVCLLALQLVTGVVGF